MAANQGIEAVDGRQAGFDEQPRLLPGDRVQRGAVDLPPLLVNHFRAAIARAAAAAEHAAQQVRRQLDRGRRFAKGHFGPRRADLRGALQDLDQRQFARSFQHLARAHLAVG